MGAGNVALGGQAGGVDKVGVRHAQLRRPLVHLLHKGLRAPRQMLGQGHGRVVGRDHAHRLEHILHRQLLVLLQPDLAAPHGAGVGGGGDGVVVGEASAVDGLHGQQDGHHLCDAGRLQGLVLVDRVEHLARGLLHQKAGLALHRQLRRLGPRGHGPRQHQGGQARQDPFHMAFPFLFLVSLLSSLPAYVCRWRQMTGSV